MKKILMTLGLLALFIHPLFATRFTSIGYSNMQKDAYMHDNNEQELHFTDIEYYKLKFGSHYFPFEEESNNLGWYIDFGVGNSANSIKHTYNGENLDIIYRSYLINSGVTYGLNNYIILFSGVGVNHSRIEIDGESSNLNSISIENTFNANLGGIFYLGNTKFGVMVEYDTSPEIFTAGFTYRY